MHALLRRCPRPQVIIVTNTYNTNNGKRVGVRYMTNGLKAYYMPVLAIADQASMPTYFSFLPLFRKILVRERIDIVHGHSATSVLMHECLLQAKAMGYKVGADRRRGRGEGGEGKAVRSCTTPPTTRCAVRVHGPLPVWVRGRGVHQREQVPEIHAVQRGPLHLRLAH